MNPIVEKFYDNVFMNLSNIYRWGGTMLVKTETDSDHVISVQCMIMQLTVVDPEIRKEIDLKDAIYRAFIHDLDEAASNCDVPRMMKYHDREILNSVKLTQSKMMRDAGWSEILCKEVDNAKESSAEGRVVAFFDTYQAFVFMQREIALGNSFMLTQLPNMIGFLDRFDYGVLKDEEYSHTYSVLCELANHAREYCEKHGVISNHAIKFEGI